MQCKDCEVEMDKGVFENSSWAQLRDKTDKLYSPFGQKVGKALLGKWGLIRNWYVIAKLKSPEFVYAYRCPKCKRVVFYSEK